MCEHPDTLVPPNVILTARRFLTSPATPMIAFYQHNLMEMEQLFLEALTCVTKRVPKRYRLRSAPTATTALAATVVAVAIIDAVAVAVVVSIFLLYACLCLPKFGDWQANLKVTLAQ